MKRTAAFTVALAVSLSAAPASLADSSVSSSSETAVATALPALRGDSGGRKKPCEYMCTQSTLESAEKAVYFVEGDQYILTINNDTYSLFDVDTRRVVQTATMPTGIDVHDSAISNDHDEVIIVGFDTTTGDLHFFRIDLFSLARTELTVTGATYAPTTSNYLDFGVPSDNSGFYLEQRVSGNGYLCKFNNLGAQVGCAASFTGTESTSPPMFSADDSRVYVLGGNDNLFAFEASDLSFTTTTFPPGYSSGFEATAMDSAGNLYFAESLYSWSDLPATTSVYKLDSSGLIEDTIQLPGAIRIRSMTVATDGSTRLYVLGIPMNADGSSKGFSYLFEISTYGAEMSVVSKTKIKAVDSNHPENVFVDSIGRYVLVTLADVPTKVIPVGKNAAIARIDTTATWSSCTWQIEWNFINLQPGRPAKKYVVGYMAPGAGEYMKVASVAANGPNSYSFAAGVEGGRVRVLPKGVRVDSYGPALLEVPPGITPRTREPRC